jgi:hypothetical protein
MPNADCWERWKEKAAGAAVRRPFPFQWLPAKPGGTGVSTCTLGVYFPFANCAAKEPLLAATALVIP